MDIKKAINYIKFKEQCLQRDVADKLGVTQNFLSDIMNDRQKPSKKLIRTLYFCYPYIEDYLASEEKSSTTPEQDRLLEIIQSQQQLITELQATIAIKDKLITDFILQKQ